MVAYECFGEPIAFATLGYDMGCREVVGQHQTMVVDA